MMKETLAGPALRAPLVARLQRLAPDSPRPWGRMTPHQAICHLGDSFRSMLSPIAIGSVATPFSTVVTWIGLNSPMTWPRGVKTWGWRHRIITCGSSVSHPRGPGLGGLVR